MIVPIFPIYDDDFKKHCELSGIELPASAQSREYLNKIGLEAAWKHYGKKTSDYKIYFYIPSEIWFEGVGDPEKPEGWYGLQYDKAFGNSSGGSGGIYSKSEAIQRARSILEEWNNRENETISQASWRRASESNTVLGSWDGKITWDDILGKPKQKALSAYF